MPRYQLDPRAHHHAIDATRAFHAADKVANITRTSWAYPDMGDGVSDHGKRWVGTNQPRTLRFTAPDDETAERVASEYGGTDAFAWNITARHYA